MYIHARWSQCVWHTYTYTRSCSSSFALFLTRTRTHKHHIDTRSGAAPWKEIEHHRINYLWHSCWLCEHAQTCTHTHTHAHAHAHIHSHTPAYTYIHGSGSRPTAKGSSTIELSDYGTHVDYDKHTSTHSGTHTYTHTHTHTHKHTHTPLAIYIHTKFGAAPCDKGVEHHRIKCLWDTRGLCGSWRPSPPIAGCVCV